jgi:hypothetical protein
MSQWQVGSRRACGSLAAARVREDLRYIGDMMQEAVSADCRCCLTECLPFSYRSDVINARTTIDTQLLAQMPHNTHPSPHLIIELQCESLALLSLLAQL